MKPDIPSVGEAAPDTACSNVAMVSIINTSALAIYSFPNNDKIFPGKIIKMIAIGIEKSSNHLVTIL